MSQGNTNNIHIARERVEKLPESVIEDIRNGKQYNPLQDFGGLVPPVINNDDDTPNHYDIMGGEKVQRIQHN